MKHEVCLQDPAELWNVDNGQLGKLFDDMVKLSLDNCLVDNRWGAVACPDAKRDPKLAVRPPVSISEPDGHMLSTFKPSNSFCKAGLIPGACMRHQSKCLLQRMILLVHLQRSWKWPSTLTYGKHICQRFMASCGRM